jgi:RNA recognition motif-containing protein
MVLAERAGFPPREDLPLPTQPPYTAFVGNLAFDLAEPELEQFFSPLKVSSIISLERPFSHISIDKVREDHQGQR